MRQLTLSRLKVCGLTRREDAALVSDLSFGAAGFILFPGSPRYVSPEEAAELAGGMSPFVKKIAVVVNLSFDECMALWRKRIFDSLQLHGDETPSQCWQLVESGVNICKAFRIHESFDFRILNDYPPGPILLDTYHKDKFGGTGESFNWNLLEQISSGNPIILSGGITPENARLAAAQPGVVAVDISSGVEITSGIKSAEKLYSLAAQAMQPMSAGYKDALLEEAK